MISDGGPVEDRTRVSCQQLVALVTEYLEGALTTERTDAVERHLAQCPFCEEYLAEIRQTMAALGRVTAQSLSQRTQDGLLAAFRDFPR